MEVHGSGIGNRIEELFYELCVKFSYHWRVEICSVHDKIRSSAQVNSTEYQRFIHGKDRRSVSADPGLVADRFRDRLSQNNAGVLYKMVAVYFKIPFGIDFEIEHAVPCEGIKHVIKKTDPGADLSFSLAVELKPDPDLCLAGPAADGGISHSVLLQFPFFCLVRISHSKMII